MSQRTFYAIMRGRGLREGKNHDGERFFLGIRRNNHPIFSI